MRQITTSSLSNQSLATALLCHTYTADADRMLFVRLFADQVAGNGTYYAYVTIQRLGTGSAYEVQPRTAPSVASGVTAIAFSTTPIPVKNTDVVKVYLLGLAGDTTTPDTVTEIWEDDSLCPTTSGRTLDVSSGGEAGVDWANVGSPTTTLNLSGTTVKTATDTAASIAALNNLSASQVATELATYDAPTKAEMDAALAPLATASALATVAGYIDTEVAAIKAKTDNLPASPAATSDIPSAATNASTLLASVLESGKTLTQAILDIWSKEVGRATANDADAPTSITYRSPDDSVQITHTHTTTTRTPS